MSRFLLVLALVCSTVLTACAGPSTDPITGISNSTKPLTSYNYAAVDALMSRSGRAVTKETPMLVGTIGNVNDVESSSTLGRTISEQLSARLAQKGYKVAELKLRQGISIQRGGLDGASSGEYLLSRDVSEIAGEHKASVALTGTYSVGARNVLINLRLLDIRSGSVITAYDYILPKNADVMAMVGEMPTSSGFFTGMNGFD